MDIPQDRRPGMYHHAKSGNQYALIDIAYNYDWEPLAFYQAMYGDKSLLLRPFSMFHEIAQPHGVPVPRFARVGDLPLEITSVSSATRPFTPATHTELNLLFAVYQPHRSSYPLLALPFDEFNLMMHAHLLRHAPPATKT